MMQVLLVKRDQFVSVDFGAIFRWTTLAVEKKTVWRDEEAKTAKSGLKPTDVWNFFLLGSVYIWRCIQIPSESWTFVVHI